MVVNQEIENIRGQVSRAQGCLIGQLAGNALEFAAQLVAA